MTGDLNTARSAVELARIHVDKIPDEYEATQEVVDRVSTVIDLLVTVVELLVVAVDELVTRAENEETR